MNVTADNAASLSVSDGTITVTAKQGWYEDNGTFSTSCYWSGANVSIPLSADQKALVDAGATITVTVAASGTSGNRDSLCAFKYKTTDGVSTSWFEGNSTNTLTATTEAGTLPTYITEAGDVYWLHIFVAGNNGVYAANGPTFTISDLTIVAA